MRHSKYILILCLSLSLACGACRKETNELAHSHEHHPGDHDHENEHHDHDQENDEHDHDSDEHSEEPAGTINLHPAVAERFGLKTSKAEPRVLSAGISAGGTVSLSAGAVAVVPAPMSGVFHLADGITIGSEVRQGATIGIVKPGVVAGGDPMRMAKVELDAAKAEFERITSLFSDRLVTVAEYNSAKAAYDRAKAAYSAPAASGVAAASKSGVIISIDAASGSAVQAGEPVATIAAGGELTLSVLMPVGDYRRLGAPRDARITVPGSGETILLSEAGGKPAAVNAVSAAATAGYVPVAFTIPATTGLVPGMAVDVFLMGGASKESLAVPRKALMEQQGTHSVFVRLDEDCYLQIPVTPGATDGEYVEILSGLKGGEDVVTEGVTAVRLASVSGNVPEGHSHSH